MLNTFADPILPVFVIMAVGFVLHRTGLFDVAVAQAINRFVFYVAGPALLFSIISSAPKDGLDLRALAVYLAAQLAVYLVTALFMYFVLKRDKGESLLLGMTASFVNHVFFVLPIAERLYGESASQPVVGIVLMDVAISFCGTVILVDLMHAKSHSPSSVLASLLKNPFLLAALLGVLAWFIQPLVPSGIFTYASFAGSAAAPASLFGLGIVLASVGVRPVDKATWTVVVAKILVHPVLVFALAGLLTISPEWDNMTLLVAAGPCGAMPFVIALKYGIRTDVIARAVLISTLISLLTLSLLAA